MKKGIKVLLLSVLLSLTLLLSSCTSSSGKGIFMMSISSQTDHSFVTEYYKFEGYKKYKIDFEKDTILTMTFTTTSGTLSCEITDSKGNVLFESEDVGNMSESITLPNKGKYTIYLEAKEHRGSFEFSWTK